MNLHLTDKVALVTGSSRGLGLASAQALAAEGARVCLCARGAETLEDAAATVRAASAADRVIAVAADLATDERHPRRRRAHDRGVWRHRHPRQQHRPWPRRGAARDDRRRVAGGVRSHAVSRHPRLAPGRALDAGARRRRHPDDRVDLRARGGRPHDVQRGEGGGDQPGEVDGPPARARQHPRQQRRAWLDLASRAARGGSASRQIPEGIAEFVRRELPFGRFGRAEEVGNVVAFLASPVASWISGASIVVDGGQSRSLI